MSECPSWIGCLLNNYFFFKVYLLILEREHEQMSKGDRQRKPMILNSSACWERSGQIGSGRAVKDGGVKEAHKFVWRNGGKASCRCRGQMYHFGILIILSKSYLRAAPGCHSHRQLLVSAQMVISESWDWAPLKKLGSTQQGVSFSAGLSLYPSPCSFVHALALK